MFSSTAPSSWHETLTLQQAGCSYCIPLARTRLPMTSLHLLGYDQVWPRGAPN
jgi:hypothetical protein